MKKALTCLLCLLMLALAALAVADSADGPITCTFSGAPYGGQDVILSFPSDYTIHYSGAGGVESISNDHIEITFGVVNGSAYSSLEEYVEASADMLRSKGKNVGGSLRERHLLSLRAGRGCLAERHGHGVL